MADNFFTLNIYTNEKRHFNGEVFSICLETTNNDKITIFANFQNTISLVQMNNIKIVLKDGKVFEYMIGEGIFDFFKNTMNILTTYFDKKEENPKLFYANMIKNSKIKQNVEAQGQNEWIEEIAGGNKE
jgi:F0F1-type ATP synthase epsilon subunit